MRLGHRLVIPTLPFLMLTGCGGSSDELGTRGSNETGEGGWRISNKQTAYEVVEFTDAEVTAGLAMMEQTVVVPGGEANGRKTIDAKCWVVLDGEGLLRQSMWCGPLVSPDGVDEWAPYPFASEPEGDGQRIIHAPMLRGQVGIYVDGDTLRRPDGAEAPNAGRPSVTLTQPEEPEGGDCQIEGAVTYSDTTLDLGDADYLDIETDVDRSDLTPTGSESEYIVEHVIRFWDDDADAGHVIRVSSVGPEGGPYLPRGVSVDPYLQTREQMESGLGSSQMLSAPTGGDGTFEINGIEGAHVVATVSRETFSGEESAELDLTLTCVSGQG